MDYDVFRQIVLSQRPDLNIQEIDRAYEFAEKAHAGQTRYSGEPYIVHPVEVANILLQLHPDVSALQAALLHDTTEDTSVTLAEIEVVFGKEVAQLVEGLEKLAVVKVKREDQQEEQWKKMFLAMARDIRIVFIKLSDRLHNMRTIQFVPSHKRERIARESLLLHSAIASRLGIYQIKSEMEDLCFQYLYPEAFQKLSMDLSSHRERSEECMVYATSQLEQLLAREGVLVEKVQGRMKHLWSIHQKMLHKEMEKVSDVHDLFAVRVVLPNLCKEEEEQVSHVYGTLGLIHAHFIPLQDRFKDYIAVPKPNGYRSLHTTVLGLGGDLYTEATEVQIRTMDMHTEAEIGIASHWSYKLGKRRIQSVDQKVYRALQASLSKVYALLKRETQLEPELRSWLESYQDLSSEERDRIESLLKEYGLEENDLMAIRRGRSQGIPRLHPGVEQQLAWLRGLAEYIPETAQSELDLFPDKIFVLTPQQKVIELPRGATPIDFAYAVHTEIGHKMVNAKVNGRIAPFDYPLQNGQVVEILTRSNAHPNRYWISLAQTASARSKIKQWFHRQAKDFVEPLHGAELKDSKVRLNKEEHTLTVKPTYSEEILVTGEEKLPLLLSACCKPCPPHPIIGYVTRGQHIRIHRQSCRELAGLEGERFVSSHWKA